MKRREERREEDEIIPDDVWREILERMKLFDKMRFSKTSKRNFLLTMESISEIPFYDIVIYDFNDVALNQFYNLNKLDLSGINNLTDAAISKLSRLQELNLSRNISITDDGIKHLTRLTQIDLSSNNSISGNTLIPIANRISILQLSENRIFDLNLLPYFTSLTTLDLYDTKINGNYLSCLTNLTILEISRSDWTNESFTNLINLTDLTLYDSEIDDSIFSTLSKLTSLYIDVARRSHGAFLSSLTNLRELTLHEVTLDYEYIRNLTRLSQFSVPMFDSLYTHGIFDGLTNLEFLDLGRYSSVMIGFETIQKLSKLREITYRAGDSDWLPVYHTKLIELPNLIVKVNTRMITSV